MSLITRNSVLLAKVEATYGTDPTPTAAADAIEVTGLNIRFPPQVIDRGDLMGGTLSPASPLIGRKMAEVTFSTELKGSGAAGTAPDHGVLMKGCGFSETVVVSTSVTYAPASPPNVDSVTMYAYMDGKLYEVNGARGTAVLRFPVGDRPMVDWTFQGFAVDPIDAAVPSPTLDATVPVPVKGVTFSLDGFAAAWSQLSVDFGNQIIATDDPNNAEGYGSFEIILRSMTGRLDPEAALVATKDFYPNFEAGTEMVLSLAVGATAGNIITLTANQAVFTDWGEGDRNGIRFHDAPFQLGRASGDDEISLAWT